MKSAAADKNPDMGKTFDKAGASLLLFVLCFLLFFRVTRSIWISFVSALLSLIVVLLLLKCIRPRSPKDLLSKRNFIRYVLLNGNAALKTFVEKALAQNFGLQDLGEHTLLSYKDKTVLIYYAYKFGSLSEEDVAKSYRLAKQSGADAIYALTNHLDRKALAVAEYIPQRFNVTGATILYKYLLKKGLIPNKDALRRKSGKATDLLKTVLKAGNAKYYVWAGLTTALLALFTPITTYYVAFSFVNLALALLTIFFSERSEGKNELFRE